MDRKLAAILAADVVGYSALMEPDEAGYAPTAQGRPRRNCSSPRSHGTRAIFKLMGDGLLAEFCSVVDAVECAVSLQRGLQNATPPFRRTSASRCGSASISVR